MALILTLILTLALALALALDLGLDLDLTLAPTRRARVGAAWRRCGPSAGGDSTLTSPSP